jgi:hypothetical protein
LRHGIQEWRWNSKLAHAAVKEILARQARYKRGSNKPALSDVLLQL